MVNKRIALLACVVMIVAGYGGLAGMASTPPPRLTAGGPPALPGAPGGFGLFVGKVCGKTQPPTGRLPAPLAAGQAAGLKIERTRLFVQPGVDALRVAGVVKNETAGPKSAALLIHVLSPGGANLLKQGLNVIARLPDVDHDWGLLAYVADVRPGEEAAFVQGTAKGSVPSSSRIDVKPYVYPGLACQRPFQVVGQPQIIGPVGFTGRIKNTGKDPAVAGVMVVILDGSGQIVSAGLGLVLPPDSAIGPGQIGEYSGTLAGSVPAAHTRAIVSVLAGAAPGADLYFP